MTGRNAGRKGRRWRNLRTKILAVSDICWLCAHPGSDSLDHVIPRSVCIRTGQRQLLEDEENLRPAHYKPCPVCGRRCNTSRGAARPAPPQLRASTSKPSRTWLASPCE